MDHSLHLQIILIVALFSSSVYVLNVFHSYWPYYLLQELVSRVFLNNKSVELAVIHLLNKFEVFKHWRTHNVISATVLEVDHHAALQKPRIHDVLFYFLIFCLAFVALLNNHKFQKFKNLQFFCLWFQTGSASVLWSDFFAYFELDKLGKKHWTIFQLGQKYVG